MDDVAKMKVLVCDDEALARMRLKRLVEMAHMEVTGEAASGREAVECAGRTRPDVVLMDIRMPDMDGLEAAGHLQKMEHPPAVIFCTAYDEHALQAFRVHAVDYLLKPVSADDLKRALRQARALNRVQVAEMSHKLAVHGPRRRRHLSARTHRGLEVVPMEEVRYFQADHKYVAVHYGDGYVLIDEPLKALEEEFDDLFVRIHRSTLASMHFMESLECSRQGRFEVRLRGVEEPLPVSRRHMAGLRKALTGKKE
ncbi:alginate biosynthesis regulator [Alcanivorax sp. 521-1]|uniref:Alginate biosynthesis regulator n=1 Tax=Alloalcanivorax profundimaris TaxID=2735259 RepID=A0ABS0ANR4_9GAMM|nr:LytTR family DNA-binding domain-containing protein [Alloalcanivorax profundimaris]MBF5055131.1 alginate biosynthesis regulator [Alloalcanivorax profundimaris]